MTRWWRKRREKTRKLVTEAQVAVERVRGLERMQASLRKAAMRLEELP